MTTLLKNLLFALGLAAILWFGYSIFVQEDDVVFDSQNGFSQTDAERDVQEFLNRLQNIQKLNIEEKIFDDQRFTTLIDHRQELIDEPTGRSNPFAPAVPTTGSDFDQLSE